MTRDGIPELLDSCESAASMIGELLEKLTAWQVDELDSALHYLDVAQAEAIAAAARLHNRLPHERPYISSQVL